LKINAPVLSSSSDRPAGAAPIIIAVCSICISLALVLGVGFASHTILRHVIQTLPCCVAAALGFRRSRVVGWVALPVFLFWLAIVVLIWLFLLGISRVVTGHFSAIEVAMTIVVGISTLAGIAAFARFKSGLSAAAAGGLFLLMAIFQWVCFRISILPALARR
jgi:hypothetical protein